MQRKDTTIKPKTMSTIPDMPKYIHVVPVNDDGEHEERLLQGYECKCNPKIEAAHDSILVIHNSFDGREGVEIVNEILKQPKWEELEKDGKTELKIDKRTLPKDGQAVRFQTQDEDWHDGYFIEGENMFWVSESKFYSAWDILCWKSN